MEPYGTIPVLCYLLDPKFPENLCQPAVIELYEDVIYVCIVRMLCDIKEYYGQVHYRTPLTIKPLRTLHSNCLSTVDTYRSTVLVAKKYSISERIPTDINIFFF